MAGKGSGAKSSGRNPAQGRSQVTRAPRARTEQRDPGAVGSKADLNEHTTARPGQQATGPTRVGANTPVPAKGPRQSSVPMVPGRGVQDQSSAATGSSIFEKADARNRMLGRRNRPTA